MTHNIDTIKFILSFLILIYIADILLSLDELGSFEIHASKRVTTIFNNRGSKSVYLKNTNC